METDTDAKEWVTIKVPVSDRDTANDYRPDDATYGDCLVAGAERLNDHLDSDTTRFVDSDRLVVGAEGLSDEVFRLASDGAEAGGPQVDDSDLAREVAAQIDYTALASKVADELEGRMR